MIEKLKQLPIRTKVLIGTLVFIIALFLTSSLVNWYKPDVVAPKTFTEAPPIAKLANVPKITISVPAIEVLEKGAVVKKIGDKLPTEVKDNTDVEIMTSATTPPSKTGYDIISTINKKDGKTSIYYTEKERSLFEFTSNGRVGVAYGISSDSGKQTAKVYGNYSFFRVGEAHLNLQAEINSKHLGQTEAIGMVGIEYRFGKD